MPQINDLMFEKLRAAGYTGAIPDMRTAYLADLGYSNMRALYEANGFASGSISDFALTYWSGVIETA